MSSVENGAMSYDEAAYRILRQLKDGSSKSTTDVMSEMGEDKNKVASAIGKVDNFFHQMVCSGFATSDGEKFRITNSGKKEIDRLFRSMDSSRKECIKA